MYPGGGSMSVAFFFVLGGFSMAVGYKDRVFSPSFSYKTYITHRCIKFFPLHWLCLFASIPLVLLSNTREQFPIFFANFSLLQSWIPIQRVYFSYNWVSWYLADTMFFAAVFPFLFKWIIRGRGFERVFITLVTTVIYVVVAVSIPQDKYHAILYISPYMRLADFVFGIYLAICYKYLKNRELCFYNNANINAFIIIFLISLLVVESSLLGGGNYRYISPLYWPLVGLLILSASLSSEQVIWRITGLQRLGNLSFVIFLTHQLVLRYIKLFFKFLSINDIFLYVSITLIITIIVSVLVDRCFLKPITKWLTKRIIPSMIVQS